MRIALTHNLRVNADASEAVFTPPETLQALQTSITSLGHEVEPVEVSGALPDTIAKLRKVAPELVFNIAEGWSGGLRQAFFPALFSHLGYPHTGSGARAQAVALDKHLTKLVAQAQGIRTPRWQLVRAIDEFDPEVTGLPAIVKPNAEGTSRGINSSSVRTTVDGVRTQIGLLLVEHPEGVLVEQYVAGRDIVVDFLEDVDNEYGGALEPVEAVWGDEARPGEFRILDYEFKNYRYLPAATPVPSVRFEALTGSVELCHDVRVAARDGVLAVGCHDIATIDFRLDANDVPYMLEVNSLPRLDPQLRTHRPTDGSGDSLDGTVAAVLRSAARRHGLRLG